MKNILHIIHNISNILNKMQAPLQQVHPQHESVGEWVRRNERIGRYMIIINIWNLKL